MDKPRRFFGLLCAHEWDIAAQSPITRSRNDECVGTLLMLRCKHCGDVTQRRVGV